MRAISMLVGVIVIIAIPSPARSQWSVFDPTNYGVNTQTAKALVEASRRLPNLQQYRTPAALPDPRMQPRSVEDIVRMALPARLHALMQSHLSTVNAITDSVIAARQRIANEAILDDAVRRAIGDLERAGLGAGGTNRILDALTSAALIGQRQQAIASSLAAVVAEDVARRAERERDEAILTMRRAAIASQPKDYGDTESWKHWQRPF